jgi:hypothetical protein
MDRAGADRAVKAALAAAAAAIFRNRRRLALPGGRRCSFTARSPPCAAAVTIAAPSRANATPCRA